MKISAKISALFFAAVVALLSSVALEARDENISFETLSHDFGSVLEDQGEVVYDYTFTNTGDTPLTILSVSASCGCTRPKYDPAPVMPGDSGVVKVTFLTPGQRGYISKNVKVRYKSAGSKTRSVNLKLTGNILPSRNE